jgi:hypothetical protein
MNNIDFMCVESISLILLFSFSFFFHFKITGLNCSYFLGPCFFGFECQSLCVVGSRWLSELTGRDEPLMQAFWRSPCLPALLVNTDLPEESREDLRLKE